MKLQLTQRQIVRMFHIIILSCFDNVMIGTFVCFIKSWKIIIQILV